MPENPKGPIKNDRPKNIVIQKLHFDKAQIAQYEDLIKEHRDQIFEKEQEISNVKMQLYNVLISNDTLQKEKLIQQLGALQSEIETIHYQHFLDIKSLCKPQQLSDFNDFTKEIVLVFKRK